VSNPKPNVGDVVAFAVTLSNKGPDAATNTQVFDLLPPGLSFVAAAPSQGYLRPGQRPVDGRNGDQDDAADASVVCPDRLAERRDEHGGDLAFGPSSIGVRATTSRAPR
jgi:uncharacterized repeat protein (TIGR01451 family)